MGKIFLSKKLYNKCIVVWDLVLKFLLKQTHLCNRILLSILGFTTMILFVLKLRACMCFFVSLLVLHVHAHTSDRAVVPPVQLTAGRKLAASYFYWCTSGQICTRHQVCLKSCNNVANRLASTGLISGRVISCSVLRQLDSVYWPLGYKNGFPSEVFNLKNLWF